eukprot:11167743-Lingulodinium_polyedra.AAC.1
MMIAPRGKGVEKVGQQLHEAKVEGEHVRIMTPGRIEVSVVKAFKRVGHWRRAGGGHKVEIRHRQQAAYEA